MLTRAMDKSFIPGCISELAVRLSHQHLIHGQASSAALIELAEGPFQNSVTDASVAEAVL